MDLTNLLSEKRQAILNRWFDAILETYPADTSHFLKKQNNQFTNPVGHTIHQGMEHILGELFCGTDLDKLIPSLDNIIRIRAVQDMTPSRAVGFILHLKSIIREELGSSVREHSARRDVLGLEERIDTLALMAFDIYLQCREKIYELKANETKRLTYRLLQRANLVREMPDE